MSLEEEFVLKKYRFYFKRDIESAFISHLDMMRLMERVLRRLDVKIKWTQGFNPHPKINFILPMSTGLIGKNEIFEVEITDDVDKSIIENMNALLPYGICILNMEEATDKIFVSEMKYSIEFKPFSEACDIINKFHNFMSGEVIITKKDGRKRDAKDYICSYTIIFNNPIYRVTFNIKPLEGRYVKPEEIINKFLKETEINAKIVRVAREEIIFKRGI